MVQFYFNIMLPSSASVDLVGTFENCFRKYIELRAKRMDHISSEIVMDTIPSKLRVASMTLLELIQELKDKELVRQASIIFARYPLNEMLPATVWECADPEDWDYVYNGKDADNLYLAYVAKWLLFTIPLASYLKQDEIEIVHRNNPESKVTLSNFYGDNSQFIITKIDELENYVQTELESLINDTFGEKVCKVTPEFKQNYKELVIPARELINSRFKYCFNNGWLFPNVRVDDENIKDCQSKRAQGLFELRNHAFNGLRVYFIVEGDTIYLGDVQTKSHRGDEQTSDMNHAKMYIDELKKVEAKQ